MLRLLLLLMCCSVGRRGRELGFAFRFHSLVGSAAL